MLIIFIFKMNIQRIKLITIIHTYNRLLTFEKFELNVFVLIQFY